MIPGRPVKPRARRTARIPAVVPSAQPVRLGSSGTEGAMRAVRPPRGFSGRPGIIKFEGCYHGHSDPLLAKAGSGVATFGIPGSPGVTEGAARDTVAVPFNDLEPVGPVAANMGVVPPDPGFLEGLRSLCDRHGALLVLDEVITGFRLAAGGAQALLGVRPDLTVLGKVMGGGFPCAAFGGRADVMAHLAPEGPVYQAGTLSGNPVAVAAGRAALDLVCSVDPFVALATRAERLAGGISSALGSAGIPHVVNRVGSLFSVFFTDRAVTNYEGAKGADHGRFARFFHGLLERGVYLPPSGFEAWFLSTAHGEEEAEHILDAVVQVAASLD